MYEYSGLLFPNLRAMLESIAFDYVTGEGSASSETIRERLMLDNDVLADEAISCFNLDWECYEYFTTDMDVARCSHMQREGYTVEDLDAAFQSLRMTLTVV